MVVLRGRLSDGRRRWGAVCGRVTRVEENITETDEAQTYRPTYRHTDKHQAQMYCERHAATAKAPLESWIMMLLGAKYHQCV